MREIIVCLALTLSCSAPALAQITYGVKGGVNFANVSFDGSEDIPSSGRVGVLAGAFAAARLLAGELYQVGRVDPAVTLGTGAVMTCVAALACWLPALRAARVDPVTILRSE